MILLSNLEVHYAGNFGSEFRQYLHEYVKYRLLLIITLIVVSRLRIGDT
jgi:hypothetical protein